MGYKRSWIADADKWPRRNQSALLYLEPMKDVNANHQLENACRIEQLFHGVCMSVDTLPLPCPALNPKVMIHRE